MAVVAIGRPDHPDFLDSLERRHPRAIDGAPAHACAPSAQKRPAGEKMTAAQRRSRTEQSELRVCGARSDAMGDVLLPRSLDAPLPPLAVQSCIERAKNACHRLTHNMSESARPRSQPTGHVTLT